MTAAYSQTKPDVPERIQNGIILLENLFFTPELPMADTCLPAWQALLSPPLHNISCAAERLSAAPDVGRVTQKDAHSPNQSSKTEHCCKKPVWSTF